MFTGPADEVHMEDLQSGLKTLFTVLRSGSVPGMTSEELASRVSLVISRSVQSVTQSSPGAGGPEADSACLCLTLVWKIVTAPSSHHLPQEARTIYEDVTRRLFRDADLMSELVSTLLNFWSCFWRLSSMICTLGHIKPNSSDQAF